MGPEAQSVGNTWAETCYSECKMIEAEKKKKNALPKPYRPSGSLNSDWPAFLHEEVPDTFEIPVTIGDDDFVDTYTVALLIFTS